MARTHKTGIDYFPLDIDFFIDEKIEFVSARFGIKGEIIAIRLLCKIYRNGYYTKWSEDESMILAKRAGEGFSPSLVSDIVKELVKRGFFEKCIFDRFNILTSRGIQKRYFEATKRYQCVNVKNDFLLVDVQDLSNVHIIPNNDNINPINEVINSQREKEKENENEIERDNLPLNSPNDKSQNSRRKKQPDALQLPFDSKEFIEAWTNLVQMPKWKKKLPLSLQMSLDKLAKYDELFAIELIKRAIEGNYQGIVFSDTDENFLKWKSNHERAKRSTSAGNFGSVGDAIDAVFAANGIE